MKKSHGLYRCTRIFFDEFRQFGVKAHVYSENVFDERKCYLWRSTRRRRKTSFFFFFPFVKLHSFLCGVGFLLIEPFLALLPPAVGTIHLKFEHKYSAVGVGKRVIYLFFSVGCGLLYRWGVCHADLTKIYTSRNQQFETKQHNWCAARVWTTAGPLHLPPRTTNTAAVAYLV